MKFANKYELFEAVTSGPVETFFAKDLASSERVLLHIFEAPEKKPDQPTVQWVLESFHRVAPDPPGLVLETGQYSGTTYAYLVTKLPEDAVLRRWTQSYQSYQMKTQEIATGAPPNSLQGPNARNEGSQASDRPSEPSSPGREVRQPGDFTAAFLRTAPSVEGRAEANTSKQANWDEINAMPGPTAPQNQPGEFTRQFFSGSKEAEQSLASHPPTKKPETGPHPNREASPARFEGAEKTAETSQFPSMPLSGEASNTNSVPSPTPGGFTALFRSDFKPDPTAPSDKTSVSSNSEKAGDFTDFFRGPFDGERPAETPNISSKSLDTPQRDAPGEFTMLFGSGKAGALDTTSPSPGQAGETKPGPFTQLFPQITEPAKPPSTNVGMPTWEPAAAKNGITSPPAEPSSATPPVPAVTPSATSSMDPMVSKPAASRPVRSSEPPKPARATHVFSAVGGRLPIHTPLPSGPSEYTRIISGGMGGKAPSEDSIAGGSVNPVSSLPKIAAPPPPKFSPPVPSAPKIPPIEGKVPKPKAAYLPLIIILNVLLFVAVLLIVYFAVKR